MNDDESGRGDQVDSELLGRRGFLGGVGTTLALALAGGGAGTAAGTQQSGLAPNAQLVADMPDNWGRWGEDDELGALNLLGSRELFAGLQAATQGGAENVARFTLMSPITGNAIDALIGEGEFPTTDAGDPAFPGRLPARKDNTADVRNAASYQGLRFSDDRFDTPLYLQGTSHVDALGHPFIATQDVNDDGEITRADQQLYNGFDAATTASTTEFEYPIPGLGTDSEGNPQAQSVKEVDRLSRADISQAANAGIAGRGVLLDVGRYKGDEENGWLDLGEAITYQDLLDTAEAQGVEIRERDIILIRTGAVERARDPDALWHATNEPGLTYSDALVEWIHEMDIPYLAADNLPVEKVPHEVTEDELDEGRKDLAGTYTLPLHAALTVNLGVTLNEVLDLSDLAAQCAEDGVYEFLFSAAPLNIVGGTGAPVNPVVVKATAAGESGDAGTETDSDDGMDTETATDTEAMVETSMQETSDATGDGFGLVTTAAGVAGLAGAAGRRLRDEMSE